MRKLAADALPVVQETRGDNKPEGWDSEAYCTNLTRALQGDLDFVDFPGARDKVLKIVRDFQNGGFKGSLQKALYNAIVSCTKYEFDMTICKRLRKWEIEPHHADVFADSQIGVFALHLKRVTRGLPHSVHMALIRTWTNSWFTSYRMNEPVKLKCIFGCDDRDDLSHYIGCEVLWTLVNSVCNAQACCLQSSVCCHLLLETAQPSSDDIVKLFLAFSCYHALKSNYLKDARTSICFLSMPAHSLYR